MQCVPLSPKLADKPTHIERTDEAAIAGEIARHLLEFSEATSRSKCVALIQKLNAISMSEPEALWVVLNLLTGDMSEITKSYSEMGKEHGKSKQAVQQSGERVLASLSKHYPECAQVIIQLRGITAHIQK